MEVHRNKIASPLPQLFYPGTSLGRFTLAELQAA